ncbi:pimeloyl-CoA dehydrogenase small subunit [Halieaceae bacterium IMCC14734]|uniref:Pimeloyl-CoA dehydrogenase small subunit n=1 Tax=Candidatus Litorirhabdus singularis TaxID=2518993 RepID=A0ABT3TBJ3_9GAMM|nr:acyl-CoA dehydrogenase family protein [Candidatus Litorirhabdus singularis]MCX2979662.1 pimeloyl-CoA dehydrogenase small subunit [Candidatus Litorirhabdus singularis]
MDFSYNEEQQMLKDSVGKFVSQDYDWDSRRAIVDSDSGYSSAHWKLFADLGWLTVPFLEADGGLGGSAVDLIVVMEEMGKGLVVEPFMANTVLAGGLLSALADSGQKEALLAPLMAGELQLALAFAETENRYELNQIACGGEINGDTLVINGHKSMVLNGGVAQQLLVAIRTSGKPGDDSGISIALVDASAAGVNRKEYTTVDGQRAADIWFESVSIPVTALVGADGGALSALQATIDRAALAVCAEAVGAMQVSLTKTVEYSKIRKQFGVSLSTFQALQHRMARMFMEVEQAKSILLMAAMAMDHAGGYAPRELSAAKSRIGKAARKVSQESVQIHGGIGVTDDLDVGHYFKRLTSIQYLFGSTDWHTRRFAAA